MEANEETRDWAELPTDPLLAVLHRLHHADVLTGAGHVCRPWRCAARDEPELWRRIDLRRPRAALSTCTPGVHVNGMAYAAVRRSAGKCEAFWADDSVDDNFIVFLSLRAPRLRSLRLTPCNISAHVLIGAITRLPMLEELELSVWCAASATTASGGHYKLAEICGAAAKACPLLKRLRLSKYLFHRLSDAGDREAMEIAKMSGLRCLQLFGNSLSNAGLAAILGGCACLESLDIRRCFNVKMNHEMRTMCARLKRLRLPDDTTDGHDLGFGNGSPESQGVCLDEW